MQVIRHEGNLSPAVVADIIRRGLADPDSSLREGALNAVVSRAAAPYFAPDASATSDWAADRDEIQRLRPDIQAALRDPEESVRAAAITAVVSLDFVLATRGPELSDDTEQLLVATYYRESSGAVKAKIIGGLATDPGVDSTSVRGLLVDAFGDSDPRVRHAASSGAAKLDRAVALPLLLRQLQDDDRSVRAESASVLARYGSTAANVLPQVAAALARERDPQVRFLLQAAIANIKP